MNAEQAQIISAAIQGFSTILGGVIAAWAVIHTSEIKKKTFFMLSKFNIIH